jgi:1-aminocyclopropane-1-carboxylate deaminase/D-cysteine desulfhydrase-like pyridoxal-dependent ACC family enzyme
MNNSLVELNNYLFEQIEKLNDDLEKEELDKEILKSKEIAKLSQTIINNAKVLLDAKKHFDEYGVEDKEINKLLRLPNEKNI